MIIMYYSTKKRICRYSNHGSLEKGGFLSLVLETCYYFAEKPLLRQVQMSAHFSSSHLGNLIFCRPLVSSSAPRTTGQSGTFSVHPSGCSVPVGFSRSPRWPRSGLRKKYHNGLFSPLFLLSFGPTGHRASVGVSPILSRVRARYLRALFSILLYHIILCTSSYMRVYAGNGHGRGVTAPPMFRKGRKKR